MELSLFELGCNGLPESFAHRFNADPVVHVGEEAFDDQPDGFSTRDAAGLCVENHLVVDTSGGRAVSTANVVGFDLEPRYRVGPSGSRKHQVVIFLVRVGALRVLLNPDHTLPHDP